ncbi:MAG: FkbM family methyltransferase [Bacteroidota bacterium]
MSKNQRNDLLYNKCKAKGFHPKHVSEVGVYLPETSNILGFIEDNIRATLVEADPVYAKAIEEYFHQASHVTLYPFAMYDHAGTIGLYKRDSSTFVSGLEASPAIINDKYQGKEEDKVYVEAKIFSEIDDQTIDLLSVDIEGCEWYVIKHMLSRPAIISVETHGKHYINPYLNEIVGWMKKNQYQVWYKDKSDTVFFKEGTITLSGLEKLWRTLVY